MQMNLPAISGLADGSNARVVLYQSGQFVHAPYGTLLVSYGPQTLTPQQQEQVRDNIGLSDTTEAVNALTGADGAFIRFTGPDDDDAVMQAIVGTVSQSAGIPTGAIIERGSGANGEYVRFADGTQICTHSFNLTFGITAYCEGSWTFPATFAANPTPSSIVTGGSFTPADAMLGFLKVQTLSTSAATFRQHRVTGQTNFTGGDTVTVAVQAIGRWF